MTEVITLGRTLAKRAADMLAYFEGPGTSNGPTEAINGRLEHLRGFALGFRNLTSYIARSLLEADGSDRNYTLNREDRVIRASWPSADPASRVGAERIDTSAATSRFPLWIRGNLVCGSSSGRIEHMFEGDLTSLSTADLLESAAEHRAEENRCAARRLEHAQIFADRHHPDNCPRRSSSDGRERGVVLGGEGCPEIAEFAVAEWGAVTGVSTPAAAYYIGQALALRHRLPFTWAKVQSGEATPWRACKIAVACLELSEDAARYVDQRVAGLVDTLTPTRLDKIVKAAKIHADPEAARAAAEQKVRERGVFVGRTDEHGTKNVYIRAATGAVLRFKATINSIAEALKILGDTRSRNARRADAIGIIADPRYTEELLLQASQQLLNQPRPTTSAPSADHPGQPSDHDAGADRASGRDTDVAPDTDLDLGCSSAGSASTATDHGDLPCDFDAPSVDDEADRDAPHPSQTDLPDPLDPPPPGDLHDTDDDGEPLTPDARRALDIRLAQIRRDAHATPTSHGGSGGRLRSGQTEIYVHLTDHTLATGNGVLRVEGLGPLLAAQLTELVGHGPYTVKPVIDLNDAISVDAYEIPERIRERIKLTHPVELFPYGTREAGNSVDLDHIQPYDALGPPGQTSTQNLAPLGRFSHRVKTHGRGWNVRRLDHKTIEWNTPNGFTFHVGPTGTHHVKTTD